MRILNWIVLLAFSATPVAADVWKSSEDSELTFVVQVDGAELNGIFTNFDVTLTTAANNSEPTEFEVLVSLTAADLGDPDTNAVLFNPAWFHTDKYAKAIFKTTKIVEQSASSFKAIGELDLKGSKKELHFPIKFKSDEESASIIGSTLINRSDFNVGSGEWASEETVGFTVELNFDVRLIRVP